MQIVVGLPVNEKHKKVLASHAGNAQLVYKPLKELTAPDIMDAEIVVGNMDKTLLPYAQKLRLLQLNSAGADAYIKPGVFPGNAFLCNATGAYGLALSEHMLGMLLAMMKKLYLYYDNQKQGLWQDEGPVTSIYGAKVLVVGMGNIGSTFAEKAHALGAHVTGIKRRSTTVPPYADAMGSMDHLNEYLAQSDIIVTSLPGTAATLHLFNKERFTAMKQGAYFLNIGRGSAVVTDDLCAALKDGHLAGAAVDVTEPEPLPQNHPAWHTPNLYITPHISGQYHLAATLDNIVNIAAENIAAYMNNKPLRNIVDFTTGYKK
jgi:phosphoglycerate dehydrogenase-like enzyme